MGIAGGYTVAKDESERTESASSRGRLCVRAIIVDDEAPARKHLQRLLKRQPEVEIVGIASNGSEAIALLEELEVELAFLDIRIPEIDGLAVAERAIALGTQVIFTTAFASHALEAFELAAVDYLLKPFDEERLVKALARVTKEKVAPKKWAEDSATEIAVFREAVAMFRSDQEKLRRFIVKKGDRILLIEPNEVEWIEASGNYVRLNTSRGKFHLRIALRTLEERLPAEEFLRISRSVLVRLGAVEQFEKATHGDYWVVLKSGERLTMSRRYRNRLSSLD